MIVRWSRGRHFHFKAKLEHLHNLDFCIWILTAAPATLLQLLREPESMQDGAPLPRTSAGLDDVSSDTREAADTPTKEEGDPTLGLVDTELPLASALDVLDSSPVADEDSDQRGRPFSRSAQKKQAALEANQKLRQRKKAVKQRAKELARADAVEDSLLVDMDGQMATTRQTKLDVMNKDIPDRGRHEAWMRGAIDMVTYRLRGRNVDVVTDEHPPRPSSHSSATRRPSAASLCTRTRLSPRA